MTAIEIIDFLNVHTEVTSNGIEYNTHHPNYKENRTKLFNSIDEINKCIDWIDTFYLPSQSSNNETDSYALKHIVEEYYKTYIPNGAFVAAFLIKEYKCKKIKDIPYIYFNFSPRLLVKYKKSLNPGGNR